MSLKTYVKNVDFSYQNTGTPVLKNINFELNGMSVLE